MKKLLYTSAIILLLLTLSCGRDASYPEISIKAPSADTAEITSFPTADYGYLIYDSENKKTIKTCNMHKYFIPASISKIFTTVFAMEVLKPDYRFSTEILYSGKITKGELNGDLILRGGGDPELSIHNMIKMISKLKSRGIKNVKGHFYYDIELFDAKEVLDAAMPANAKYNTGFGPLNLNKNIIYAIKKTDETGKLTSCEIIPSVPSNSVYLYDGPPVLLYAKYSNVDNVENWGLPSHGKWENRFPLPVKNTALFTSSVFRELCFIHGITLPCPIKGSTTPGAKKITVHKSRKLSLMINDMLITSDNLTAELIGNITYNKLSRNKKNRTASVEKFFKKTFPSIMWDEFRLTNYSGLTDMNRATPEQTTAMLVYLSRIKLPEGEISKLLPLSGLDGTMKSKLDSSDTAFRVYAKTGSIYYASALAGEFIGLSGKKYLFSIFINNKDKRKLYISSGKHSIEEAKKAEKWSTDAANAIELFITKQIKEL